MHLWVDLSIPQLLKMKKITILVPAYNEGANIPVFVREIHKLLEKPQTVAPALADRSAPCSSTDAHCENEARGTFDFNPEKFEWELLFVNDGSTDDTLRELRKLRRADNRINILNLSRNFGKENAMLAGLDYAKGDAVIIMDADLQDPVSLVPVLIHYWIEGYDDVYGRRNERGQESWLRKCLSLTFYKILRSCTRIEILPNVGDFRLLDRRVVNAICNLRETQRYTKGLFCWVGYDKKEVVFDRDDRKKGKSSFNFKRLTDLAIEGITSFTTAPLRFASVSGFILSFVSIIYLIYVFIKTLIYGDPVQGFPTLLCVILLLGGFQLIVLGIIGEYIGRIFNETKQRPPYIVESYNEERL